MHHQGGEVFTKSKRMNLASHNNCFLSSGKLGIFLSPFPGHLPGMMIIECPAATEISPGCILAPQEQRVG